MNVLLVKIGLRMVNCINILLISACGTELSVVPTAYTVRVA